MAEQLGVSRKEIADAEHGKATTGIGVYAGMFWVLGLESQLERLATPDLEPAEEFALETDRKRAPRRRARSEPGNDDVPF